MIRLPIFSEMWLVMRVYSLSPKIWKLTCKFISIRGFIATELVFISKRLYRHFTREKMVFPTKIGGLLDGTQCRFRPIHPAVLSFLSTPSDTLAILAHLSGQIGTRTSLLLFWRKEFTRPTSKVWWLKQEPGLLMLLWGRWTLHDALSIDL